jgi:hypothetical protein
MSDPIESNAGPSDLTLNLTGNILEANDQGNVQPNHYTLVPYEPERQRDYVRLVVTVSLLAMLFWLVIWASIESKSWPDHWKQTQEMLQTIFPAVIGLIGSVIGFYFGSGANQSQKQSPPNNA